jgi:5-formyltetrahydrofolate cyclo-ligase
MTKEQIRDKILRLRTSLPQKEAIIKSLKVQECLFRLPEFVKAKIILFYVSTKNEVKTENMIKQALKNGKRVVIPISNIKEKTLTLSELKDFNKELEPGSFNILEPKKEFIRKVSPEEIDLIIVPGVAFDKEGDRIGYGMGFYDNFLSSLKKSVPVIGLAYELQIVDEIPVDDKDVTVDKIVTEERIIKCY